MTHARISRIEILLKRAQTGKNSGVKAHIKRGTAGNLICVAHGRTLPPRGQSLVPRRGGQKS